MPMSQHEYEEVKKMSNVQKRREGKIRKDRRAEGNRLRKVQGQETQDKRENIKKKKTTGVRLNTHINVKFFTTQYKMCSTLVSPANDLQMQTGMKNKLEYVTPV